MALVFLALMAAAAQPSAEAKRLGRTLASQGTLASLLPLMKASQTEELLAEDKDLSAEQKTRLRATADRVFDAGYERILATTGDAYARQLDIADLRTLTRFNASPAAGRYRAAIPGIMVEATKAMDDMDFKRDVRAAFCAEARRLCVK